MHLPTNAGNLVACFSYMDTHRVNLIIIMHVNTGKQLMVLKKKKWSRKVKRQLRLIVKRHSRRTDKQY